MTPGVSTIRFSKIFLPFSVIKIKFDGGGKNGSVLFFISQDANCWKAKFEAFFSLTGKLCLSD